MSVRGLVALASLAFLALAASAAAQQAEIGVAGDTTIATGGTAQLLFGGVIPANGWTVINPDAAEDCWASDSTTAVANGTGSIRLAANGGGYETPARYRPPGAVSVVCATTGHKLTARMW